MNAPSSHVVPGGALRQSMILLILTAGMVLLHRVAVPQATGFDPSAMLACGFVVLASYTVGKLVEALRLPHITGYLLAGVLFGQSCAALLPELWRIAPFDRGVLNGEVIRQLSLLDALAVALIALNAGGEIKLESLRRGLKAILATLVGQVITVLVFVTALVVAMSGVFPGLTLPGIAGLQGWGVLSLGLLVGSIAFATSPAATLAVIHDTKARGPVSRHVLSTVVLKDVVVVILFSLSASLVARSLGIGGNNTHFWRDMAVHIGGSIAVGAGLGGLMILYLRYVRHELMLFLIGVIYTAAYAAQRLHLEPVLMFITAGVMVVNVSRQGEVLIASVQKLSMPVFVVFFTLAGASLHLDHVIQLAPYALALVLVRVLALFLGSSLAAKMSGGDAAMRRYSWMGFVSQAGVALSLAALIGQRFGQAGQALETLVVATIAINELVGPVLWKFGITLARERPGDRPKAEAGGTASQPPHASPVRKSLPGDETPPSTDAEEAPAWENPKEPRDPWGPLLRTGAQELNRSLAELQGELVTLVQDVAAGPLAKFRDDAEIYLRELRREFLRHHRRLRVQARTPEGCREMALLLRTEQAELTDRWRGIVLGRSARFGQPAWTPDALVDLIDARVEALPKMLEAPIDTHIWTSTPGDSWWRSSQRALLRLRVGVRRALGGKTPTRRVKLRELARFHLSGHVPSQLEGLAALLVQADYHLADRTRAIFAHIVRGYEELHTMAQADADESACDPLQAAIQNLVEDIEGDFELAWQELDYIVRDAVRRIRDPLSQGLAKLKEDVLNAGTFALPAHQRHTSRLFRQRLRALDLLQNEMRRVRQSSAAAYGLLSLELELMGLEVSVNDALYDLTASLEKALRGRAVVPLERAKQAVDNALGTFQEKLGETTRSEQLLSTLREEHGGLEKLLSEASSSILELHHQLVEDRTVGSILDVLRRSSRALTQQYTISLGRPVRGEWKLPPAVTSLDVPFRELVNAYLDSHVVPRLVQWVRDIATKAEPLSASVQDLERRFAFNIEIVLSELEVDRDEGLSEQTRRLIHDMVYGGMERGQVLLEAHLQEVTRWYQSAKPAIEEAVIGGLRRLRHELSDGQVTQSRIDTLRRSVAGRRILKEAGKIPRHLARSQEEVGKALRGWLGQRRLETWQEVLGIPRSTPVGSHPQVFSVPEPQVSMPLVYRRLFAAETLEAGDVLTGREDELERARLSLSPHQSTRLAVVVGHDGIGKASLTNAIVRGRNWKNVKRWHWQQPVSSDEVDAVFESQGDNHLIVVEGLHWLIDSGGGGFAMLRRFRDHLAKPGRRGAWMLTADPLVWQYACQIAQLGTIAAEPIILHPLAAAELEAAVLARHALSGYGLSFDPPHGRSGFDRFLQRHVNRLQRPYQRFFQHLHEASGGLIRDALRLWLASIRQIDEKNDFVHLGDVPEAPLTFLRTLSDDDLLHLFVISRQGWIDAAGFAELFRLSAGTAQAQLTGMAQRGLLQRQRDSDVFYRVHIALRGALTQVLSEQQWVH